jgi:hypothetical protein
MRTHRSSCSRTLSLLIPLLLLYPVAAQSNDDLPPSTLTLDRMDNASRFGIQVDLDKIDSVDLSDGFVMRFEPYGQYILPNRLVGIYAQLPISHLFDSNGTDATGIGNLEVGALFLPHHDGSLILRSGLALGTASGYDDDGLFPNVLSGYGRMTDFILVAPKYTTLRLSGSTVQQSGIVFFRADLGLELAVDKPSGGDALFMHANIAVGVRTSAVDLSAELVNFANLEGSGSVSQRFIHTLAFGFRTRGPNQLLGGAVFPLDEALRGEIWIFSLGFQHVTD